MREDCFSVSGWCLFSSLSELFPHDLSAPYLEKWSAYRVSELGKKSKAADLCGRFYWCRISDSAECKTQEEKTMLPNIQPMFLMYSISISGVHSNSYCSRASASSEWML